MPADHLAAVLEDLRKRIAKSKRDQLEQNTKATLIEPLLRALGWDTEDMDQVVHEYRRPRSKDNPVDYGLLVAAEPRLFVEAKALGHSLDDPRWASQIVGYAVTAGVRWVVLTNGDEYRIYNTHAEVPIEEKLFRKVRVSDAATAPEESLGLLAREKIGGNLLSALWIAHFVDRQVKAALETLFSPENDMAIVNLVQQRTKELSADQIRASLRRCDLEVKFPMVTEAMLESSKPTTSKEPAGARAGAGVTLQQLLGAGFLRAPVDLNREYRGHPLKARIESDGSVTWNEKRFTSLSAAGSAAKASVAGLTEKGEMPATDGWAFWNYCGAEGEWLPIDHARQLYMTSQKSSPASRTRAQES